CVISREVSVSLRIPAALFVLGLWSSVAAPAAAADGVNTCGILKSFIAPTETHNVGQAIVDDTIYYLSGTPGPNTLSPDPTVARSVCLTGVVAQSEASPTPLLIRWSLSSNTNRYVRSDPWGYGG